MQALDGRRLRVPGPPSSPLPRRRALATSHQASSSQPFPATDEELVIRGYVPPVEASNWYASPEEFAAVYEAAGFTEIDARLIERPTPLAHGVDQWVTTFRKGWLDRACVPEGERAEIGTAVADRVGSNIADYVRLRFIMRKPN